MKNVTDTFISLGHYLSARIFGFNTDILATNPINLSVVLGVLIFLERECVRVVYFKNRLDQKTVPFPIINNQKQRILNTIRNSEKLRGGVAIKQLEKDRSRLRKQREINQIPQRVFQQALRGALGTLNSCLNNELHLRTISANIGMLGKMKEITY
uniref:ATP synthase CF0 subunit I n=1 Tax=Solanum lycopersicum TaxID=4081 RepID=A0A3Q7IE35_SOLLC